MTDHAKRTGVAVEAHYQFLTWLVPTVDKFPLKGVVTGSNPLARSPDPLCGGVNDRPEAG